MSSRVLLDILYILIAFVPVSILALSWYKTWRTRRFFRKCERGTLLLVRKCFAFLCDCDTHYMLFDRTYREYVDLKYICSQSRKGKLYICIFGDITRSFSMMYSHFGKFKVVNDKEMCAKVLEWYMKKRR